MKIVVTGASGNVGTALLRQLTGDDRRRHDSHDVVAISRRPPAAGIPPYDGARWWSIDIGAPDATGRLAQAMAGADAVVHLAWLIQPSHDREYLRRVNQGGTRAVIDAAVAAGVAHLVHMSSVGTYAAAAKQWKDESWSTAGVPTSSYSVDKSACERLLDDVRGCTVSRVRPGLILQPDAASEISRYFIGRLVPYRLLRPGIVRWAPFPRDIAVQFIHADDVARALVAVLDQRFTGPLNLAAEPVIDRAGFRQAFGRVGPPVPTSVLRAGAQLSWRSHLQPTDGGWVDLGAAVPLLKTDRARTELGWSPEHRADDVLRDFVVALSRGRGAAGPLLYPRGKESVS